MMLYKAIAMRKQTSKKKTDLATTKKSEQKKSYSLKELIEQCDINAPIPEDIKAFMDMPAVGKEIT
jgi:hypothetical protein